MKRLHARRTLNRNLITFAALPVASAAGEGPPGACPTLALKTLPPAVTLTAT
jgi:hypothetical protein